MPHADRLNLREALNNNVDLVMISPDPEYTQKAHGERSVLDVKGLGLPPNSKPTRIVLWLVLATFFLFATWLRKYGLRMKLWGSAAEVLDELLRADLVFNVGGGNLNSVIPQELYKKAVIYTACRLLGKPVILSGQTIGITLITAF